MKRLVLLFCIMALCASLWAQKKEYFSFITDRRFPDVTDLQGFPFNPNEMQVKGAEKVDLTPGQYSFAITQNNLYVAGGDIKGVYSVNSIKPTEFGYMLSLMNARDPTLQGHLKVILNPSKQVDVLIFKRSVKEKEIIFYLSEMSDEFFKKEGAWFTDLGEFLLPAEDSLWGKRVKPFLLIDRSTSQQQRLQVADSTDLAFIETIKVIDKRKKTKEQAAQAPLTWPLPDSLQGNSDIKLEKVHTLVLRTTNFFDDGRVEVQKKEMELESVNIRENKGGSQFMAFEVVCKPKSGQEVVLFLDKKRCITYFNYGTRSFLMRGY